MTRSAMPSNSLPVSDDEARNALSALIANPSFKATERNRRFLSFVVNEMLAGRGEAVKAYSIAIDVFGRSNNFDPSTDPIVRIEAMRLRGCLSQFYLSQGSREPIQIELPKGRYVPVFVRVSSNDADDWNAPARPSTPTLPDENVRKSIPIIGKGPSRGVLLVGLCAFLTLATALLWAYKDNSNVSARPLVSIVLRGQPNSLGTLALRDRITIALSRFGNLRVVSNNELDGSSPNQAASKQLAAQYRIDFELFDRGPDRGIWWQVVDLGAGETVRSDLVRASIEPGADGQDDVIGMIANGIAGPQGAITLQQLALEMKEPTLGAGCIVRAGAAIRLNERAALQLARECLEATLKIFPNDTDTIAALSMVLIQLDTPHSPTSLGPEALILARRAATLDPTSDRAATALMLTRFRNGQVEAALAAGRRALELNPYNAVAAAKLGAMLFVIGREAEGMDVIAAADRIDGDANPEVLFVIAMNNYRNGRFAEALQCLDEMDDPHGFGQGFVRLATLGQLGRNEDIAAWFDRDGNDREALERLFYPAMIGRHVSPALVEDLRIGLVKAGLSIAPAK